MADEPTQRRLPHSDPREDASQDFNVEEAVNKLGREILDDQDQKGQGPTSPRMEIGPELDTETEQDETTSPKFEDVKEFLAAQKALNSVREKDLKRRYQGKLWKLKAWLGGDFDWELTRDGEIKEKATKHILARKTAGAVLNKRGLFLLGSIIVTAATGGTILPAIGALLGGAGAWGFTERKRQTELSQNQREIMQVYLESIVELLPKLREGAAKTESEMAEFINKAAETILEKTNEQLETKHNDIKELKDKLDKKRGKWMTWGSLIGLAVGGSAAVAATILEAKAKLAEQIIKNGVEYGQQNFDQVLAKTPYPQNWLDLTHNVIEKGGKFFHIIRAEDIALANQTGWSLTQQELSVAGQNFMVHAKELALSPAQIATLHSKATTEMAKFLLSQNHLLQNTAIALGASLFGSLYGKVSDRLKTRIREIPAETTTRTTQVGTEPVVIHGQIVGNAELFTLAPITHREGVEIPNWEPGKTYLFTTEIGTEPNTQYVKILKQQKINNQEYYVAQFLDLNPETRNLEPTNFALLPVDQFNQAARVELNPAILQGSQGQDALERLERQLVSQLKVPTPTGGIEETTTQTPTVETTTGEPEIIKNNQYRINLLKELLSRLQQKLINSNPEQTPEIQERINRVQTELDLRERRDNLKEQIANDIANNNKDLQAEHTTELRQVEGKINQLMDAAGIELPEEIRKRREGSRWMAEEFTINRIKSYKALTRILDADGKILINEIERYQRRSRHLWENLAVHGKLYIDREQKPAQLKVAAESDLDGIICLGLMHEAGIDTSKIKFIKPGSAEAGRVNVDTGNRDGIVLNDPEYPNQPTAFYDHHGPGSLGTESASQWVYLGLIADERLEPNSTYDNLITFINQVDNLNYSIDENKYLNEMPRTLYGLANFFTAGFNEKKKHNPTFKNLIQFFEDGHKPDEILSDEDLKKYGFIYEDAGKQINLSTEQSQNNKRSAERLRQLEEEGWVFDSNRYGKIVVDIFGQVPGRFDAARALGYDTYIAWDPTRRQFSISAIKQLDPNDTFSVGFPVRDHMWIKPMAADEPELDSSILSEIIDKLTDHQIELTSKQIENRIREIKEGFKDGKIYKSKKDNGEPIYYRILSTDPFEAALYELADGNWISSKSSETLIADETEQRLKNLQSKNKLSVVTKARQKNIPVELKNLMDREYKEFKRNRASVQKKNQGQITAIESPAETRTTTTEKKERKRYFRVGTLYQNDTNVEQTYYLITQTNPLDGTIFFNENGEWQKERIGAENELLSQERRQALKNSLDNGNLIPINKNQRTDLFARAPELNNLVEENREDLIPPVPVREPKVQLTTTPDDAIKEIPTPAAAVANEQAETDTIETAPIKPAITETAEAVAPALEEELNDQQNTIEKIKSRKAKGRFRLNIYNNQIENITEEIKINNSPAS
ncbi:MAG: hypothetical protein PHW50_02605, partial [Patescibacteria group bacterium]|nr:hypothetical protein [Patescibacteria group bacterium]